MSTLTYTVPVAGSTLNSVADPEVATALSSILTWAAGDIDGTNVAATLTGRRLVMQSFCIFGSSVAGETIMSAADGSFIVSGASTAKAVVWSYLDPANFAVTGKSNTQLILRMSLGASNVASTVNFTAALNPITWAGSGGGITPTAGSAVSGSSVTITAPTVETSNVGETSAFTFPAAGGYVPTVTNSGATASNSSTTIMLQLFAVNS